MAEIAIDRIRRLRYALGAASLLAGGGMLWFAPRRGFVDEPIGWLFVVASIFLLTYRNYIEVSPALGRLAHRTGFGIGFIRKRYDTGSVEQIEIRDLRETDEDGDEQVTYGIAVKGSPGGPLCEHEEMGPARLIAERVARAANVPLQNRLFGGLSIRKPDDLDLSLAERWRRAGLLKEAPVIDADSSLAVNHAEDSSEISTPVPKFPRAIATLVGLSLIAVTIALKMLFELPLLPPSIFIAVFAWFTFMFVARHSGRDRLRFDSRCVEFRRGLMPHRQSMKISDIEEILAHGDEIVLMSDREYIRIERPPEKRDRELQRQFIERQISQRQIAPRER